MTRKGTVYRLIDELSEAELEIVHAFLTRLRESSLPAVLADAPWDDEPEPAEERAAVAEAEADFRRGRIVSHAHALRRLLSD